MALRPILFFCFFMFFFQLLLMPSGGAADFQEFGIRPMGMGFAFTAVSDDLNSLVFNPAGLSRLGPQFENGFYDLKNLQTLQKEGWAVAMGPVAYGQYLIREKTGRLTRAFISGGGWNLENWGQLGLAWKKYEASDAGDLGWGLDFGYLNRQLFSGLTVGLLAKNVFKEKINEPIIFRGGAAYQIEPSTLLAVDFETGISTIREFSKYQVFYGMEVQPERNFSYRVGWSQRGLSAGVSWVLPFVTLEYALINVPDAPEAIQCFGLKFSVQENLNQKETDR